jgi:phosphoglycerate dehydrogenase-like enzyme
LVGFGSITSHVAERASGFDLDLVAHDSFDVAAILSDIVHDVSSEMLLSESDRSSMTRRFRMLSNLDGSSPAFR